MSTMLKEELVDLSQASSLLPKINGAPVHPSTVSRWTRAGINGVRLETVAVGGRTCTSREAVQRFLQRTNTAAAPTPQLEACAV